MVTTPISDTLYDAATGLPRTSGQLRIRPKTFIPDGASGVVAPVTTLVVVTNPVSLSLAPSRGIPYVVEFDPTPLDTTTPLKAKPGYFMNTWNVPLPNGQTRTFSDLV